MKVSLTDICDFQGGTQPPKNEWSKECKPGYIRMLQIRDFTQSEKDNVEYIKETPATKKCTENDILIGRYGASVGKILTGLSGAYNVALVKAIPDNAKVLNGYLFHYFNSPYFQKFILSVGSRAAQAGFNKNDLQQAAFPLLNLSEQKQIVVMLDNVNKLIFQQKQQLSKLDEFVKARFIELFGEVPDEQQVTMEEVCSIITDGTHQPPQFVADGIPFLFVSNIAGNLITYDTEKFITEETYNELIKRTPIAIGDILLSTVGSYGHPAIVKQNKPFCFQRHIACLKPKSDVINSTYLHGAILSHDVQRQIKKRVKGIAQKTLNLSEIRKLHFPLPSMEEQKQFADFIEYTDKLKLTIQASIDKLEVFKKSLMQEYFG